MNRFIILISVLFFTLASCENPEGKGGSATIKGTVIVNEWNKDFTILVDTYPAQDVDVYLIYGDDEVYGDKFKTGYDGKYEFDYLQTGKYTIYVMSKELGNTTTNELIPVFKEVEITGKTQTVVVDTINIID